MTSHDLRCRPWIRRHSIGRQHLPRRHLRQGLPLRQPRRVWSERLSTQFSFPGRIASHSAPANARLLDGDPIEFDESALTGELLPARRQLGGAVYYGSVLRKNEIRALDYATGVKTYFASPAIDKTEVR